MLAHATSSFIVIFVFFVQHLHLFFHVRRSLDLYVSNGSESLRAWTKHTFGSRFIAMVKCLIALVLSLTILYSLPSMKCTFAESGARSFRISSSANASFGRRRFINTRAFFSLACRAYADFGSRSHAWVYCTSAAWGFFIFSRTCFAVSTAIKHDEIKNAYGSYAPNQDWVRWVDLERRLVMLLGHIVLSELLIYLPKAIPAIIVSVIGRYGTPVGI